MRMKKIFSLIVACALVMSVSAVPFGANHDKSQALKRVAAQKVRYENAGSTQAKHFAKVAAKPVQTQERKRVAASVASTVTLDFPKLKFSDHVADLGWWQLNGSNAEGYYVTFSPTSTTSVAGTYSMTDMDPDYTYLHDGTDYIDFTAGTIVVTVDATSGLVSLSATMTGDDGNTYVITAQEKVAVVSTNVITLSYANGQLNITTTNDDPYFVALELKSAYDSYQSDYSQTSLDAEIDDWISSASYYGYLSDMTFSGSQLLDLADYYETLMGSEMEEGTYVVLVAPIDEDERNGSTVYNQFDFVPAPFVPNGETINVVFNMPVKMKYYSSEGDWWIQAAREGLYAASLDMVNNDSESPVGTYETEDFLMSYTYVTVYADSAATSGKKLKPKAAEAIVTEANDTISIEANVLASDGYVYAIQMYFAKPVALNEETIEAENLVVEASYFSVYAIASDSLYGVSLSFTPDSTLYTGEYTIGENATGSITILADGTKSDVYSGWFIIDIDDEGQYTLEGEILCYNNTQYTLDLTYVLPEQTREDVIIIADAQLGIYDGAWQALGYNADQSRYVSIAAYADVVAGTYTKNELALNYTYVVELGADTTFFSVLTADLAVAFNEADSTFTIAGTILAQNEDNAADVPFYTILMSGKLAADDPQTTHLEYDAEDEDFNVDFATYNVDTEYIQYGVVYVEAQNSANKFIGLEVILPENASTLVAGVYPIDYSQGAQTVSASSGVNSNNQLTYSLAGSQNAQGYVEIPIWFMVSGTMTVNADGSIVVDALNSYGRTIHSVLGAQTAVENVSAEAAASKRIVNGMLLIERNGAVYNAQGIRQ